MDIMFSDPKDLLKKFLYELAKYFAAACFIFATVIMFNPKIAGYSPLPWASFLTGNFVWAYDSYKSKNKPWLILSFVFCLLDVFLIWARLTGYVVQF